MPVLPSLLPAHLVLCVPEMRVADPIYNAAAILQLIDREINLDANQIFLFPELSLSGSSAGDLLRIPPLAEACLEQLLFLEEACRSRKIWAVIGLPLKSRWGIFNAAAVLTPQGLTGFSLSDPKINPHCSSLDAPALFLEESINVGGRFLPTSPNAVFNLEGILKDPIQVLVGKPGDDVIKQSCGLILNLYNRPALAFGANRPESWAAVNSRRLNRSVASCSVGPNESTTDQVFSGEAVFYQAGYLLAASKELEFNSQALSVNLSLAQKKRQPAKPNDERSFLLTRYPFIDEAAPSKQFQRVIDIQAAGLIKRLRHIGHASVVMGLSGGADSSMALLVCLHAFRKLGYPAAKIIAVSMPGPGTSQDALMRIKQLAKAAGVTLRTIPIHDALDQHLKDIGHPADLYDISYENSQARERTQILMALANQEAALMVGTGDLSEIALGWNTFNGDHISFYNVNAGLPKTLLLRVLPWAGKELLGKAGHEVCKRIAAATISPELIPRKDNDSEQQSTEESIGPYMLHDFFLYHFIRLRSGPREIFEAARQIFNEREPAEILKWLSVFYQRFFAAQFKRSASSDGPQLTEVSLSPRNGWQMPSDAEAQLWLNQINDLKEGLH
jgi:NAD+ synthase (glutamine-hydrolysing)